MKLPLILGGLGGVGLLALLLTSQGEPPARDGDADGGEPPPPQGGELPAPAEWTDAADARAREIMEAEFMVFSETGAAFDLGWHHAMKYAAAKKIWPEWDNRVKGQPDWPPTPIAERLFWRKADDKDPVAPEWMQGILHKLESTAQEITGFRPVT